MTAGGNAKSEGSSSLALNLILEKHYTSTALPEKLLGWNHISVSSQSPQQPARGIGRLRSLESRWKRRAPLPLGPGIHSPGAGGIIAGSETS